MTWTSSDETIATVDENGAVTAIKAGSVIITATTANGLTATCEVIVSAESGITKIIVDSKVTVRVENSIIKVSDAKIGELCNIYQADGRLLQSFKISGAIVETRPMPSGIYIVIVDDTIRKIIVR